MSLALLEGRKNQIREKPYNSFGLEEKEAIIKIMDEEASELSGFVGRAGEKFLGGKYVKKFEKDFREYFNVKHAISFNSATTALQAAVAALGIGPGDEVITTPFTMSATATAILLNNALPVFADIDLQTFCIDPVDIEKKITPRTKAILAVNLFGAPADYEKIKSIAERHNLKIIEDNAQSAGATQKGAYAGTIGDIGIFSFNVHKIIQIGEGGMLVANSDAYAFRAQLARNHGEAVLDDLASQGIYEPVAGSNYRLTELHAAIGIEQLKKLKAIIALRRQGAEYLSKRMKEFSWVVAYEPPQGDTSVYYDYVFRVLPEKLGLSRCTFAKAMEAEGFPVSEGYQKPLYLFPLYQKQRMFPNSQYPFVSADYPYRVDYSKGICPVAERMFERELATTTIFQPPNTQADINGFVFAMKEIESHIGELREYEAKASR